MHTAFKALSYTQLHAMQAACSLIWSLIMWHMCCTPSGGHALSNNVGLHQLLFMQGFTLLKLANPHGRGGQEWGGAWSNNDTKSWRDNPEVGADSSAKQCGFRRHSTCIQMVATSSQHCTAWHAYPNACNMQHVPACRPITCLPESIFQEQKCK